MPVIIITEHILFLLYLLLVIRIYLLHQIELYTEHFINILLLFVATPRGSVGNKKTPLLKRTRLNYDAAFQHVNNVHTTIEHLSENHIMLIPRVFK